jgi:hypothetical protein
VYPKEYIYTGGNLMLDFIFAPFKAAGEFIIWALIIYGVVQMAQLIGFLIRGYYTLKFMKHASALVADLAFQIAEMRRQLPVEIAEAERKLASPSATPLRLALSQEPEPTSKKRDAITYSGVR